MIDMEMQCLFTKQCEIQCDCDAPWHPNLRVVVICRVYIIWEYMRCWPVIWYSLLFPPTGCSRADTLLNVHFVLFFTVFPASRQCCPGGGRGGGRNNCFFEWCFLPLSICTGFYSVFRSFALFFLHHLRFPLVFTVFSGFMTLLMLRCTLGWGGVGWGNHVHVKLITLLRLHHVADATGGMLTFHVTCSRCWCYATLGWGGMLTFHVTCSRCWCYATLGWRGDINVPCNLLTLLMLRHAGVGGMLTFHVTCSRCWCYATLGWGGVNVPCNLLTLLMLRHAGVGGNVNVPCNLLTLLMLRHAGVGGDVNVPCNLLTLLMLRHAGVGGMLTFHVSMGVSVAQHVLESECNVETSDSAKMTKKSAAREQAVRPLLFFFCAIWEVTAWRPKGDE